MGRPKKDENYFDRTAALTIRIDKDILAKFIEAFHTERHFARIGGKPLFLKNVMQDMLQGWTREHLGAGENLGELKKKLLESREDLKDIAAKIHEISSLLTAQGGGEE